MKINLFALFQWSPDKASVFGSSAEDGILNIWDYEKVQNVSIMLLLNTSCT